MSDTLYCGKCGAPNRPGPPICYACGYSLKKATTRPPQEPVTAAPVSTPSAPVVAPVRLHTVHVTDLDIPFGSVIRLVFKFFIASIPVAIFVGIIVAVFGALMTGCLAALGGSLR